MRPAFALGIAAALCCLPVLHSASYPVACTGDAKLCPDGSAVGRTGPNCEFASCPSSPAPAPTPPPGATCNMGPVTCPDGTRVVCRPCPGASGGAVGGSPGSAPTAKIVTMDDAGLSQYADLPLIGLPPGSVTLQFVVQHRSALNQQHVTVRGIVISTLLGEQACPTNPMLGMACAQPRIVLADSSERGRDKNYDLMVLLSPTDKTEYDMGQAVSLTGTVSAGKNSVVIRKDYEAGQ